VIDLIGVPLELGADHKGIRKGPDAIRKAGLLDRLLRSGYQVRDKGNLSIPATIPPERDPASCKHLRTIRQVNEELCESVFDSLKAGRFPLVIGGDHSIALGSLAGASKHFQDLGVIWIDAHGDFNTDRTTPSGNIHGMPLAASMGIGHPELTSIGSRKAKIEPKHTVLIGVRSLDPGEQELIEKLGIQVFTVDDIRRLGIDHVIDEAIRIAGEETKGIHLSFDLDVLDSAISPGVSTPVPGGLGLHEAGAILEGFRQSGRLISAEFVELNPELDHNDVTAKIAVELVNKLIGGDNGRKGIINWQK
jgi:arginase